MNEVQIATTVGLLCDGRELTKDDRVLGRWVSAEWRRASRGTWASYKGLCGFVQDKLREACGGRLPAGVPAKVTTLIARCEARHARRPTPASRSVVERRARVEGQIALRIFAVLVPAFARGDYRTAKSKWARVVNAYTVLIGEPRVSRSVAKEWSNNGKWSGSSCETTFVVRPTWMRDVGAARALVNYRGHMLLVLDRRIERGQVELRLVMPGKGYELHAKWVRPGPFDAFEED